MTHLFSKFLRLSLCLLALWSTNIVVAQSETITVCDGTDTNKYVPFYFYYLDNASATSQVIYPATELQSLKGKQITGVKFYNEGYASAWNSHMAVSLAEVSFSQLADDNAAYISADYTEVFNGAMSGDETMNTLEFTFATPMVYTGQNLVIEIKNTTAGSTYMQVPFYGVDVTEHINAAYGYNNTFKYNESFLPKVTFTYEEVSEYGAKVSTDKINFSTIFTGEQVVKEFTITNTGANDLTGAISGVELPYSIAETQLNIPSLASVTIPVTFAPTADGVYEQTLSIDLGEAGILEVDLSGTSMTAPTGYTVSFDVADKTLPENWIGWNVKGEYNYDTYEYDFVSAEAYTDYFVGTEIDGVKAVSIYENANPRKSYPNQFEIYMVSPVVKGNVMITARGTYSEYTSGYVTVYQATLNEDSTVTIGEEPIEVTWLPEFNNQEWCKGIFSLSEDTRLAIFMSYGAVATLAADELVEEVAVEMEVGTTFEKEGLTYIVKEGRTLGVVSVSSEITQCDIPATITMSKVTYTVVSIEDDAFYWSNVTNVALPGTITTIGYGAFRSSPLATINLPETLQSIGDYAFYKTELTSIVIPDGVTELGASTFAQCEKLTDVTLPATLQKIGQGAFYKCAVTSLNIPATCHSIGMFAFEHCTQLTDVTLPEGLQELAMGLFRDCSSLAQVTIPQSVTTIKEEAFQNTAITAIHFPAHVSEIETNAFNDVNLTSISVDEANTTFTVIDGALYTADKRFIYLYPRVTESKEYDIIEGCVAVWGGAFYGCDIKRVTFPDNFIGIDAFGFCYSQLESVELPHSIEVIWEQAFAGTQLSTVVVPNGVTQLSDAVFASCPNLTSVTLPEGLTAVGNRAFFECTSLSEIICKGNVPAEFDAWETYTNPFFGVDCSLVTIKCPIDYVADYQLSEWGDFFSIFEGTDFTGLSDNLNHETRVTTADGRIVVALDVNLPHNITISDVNGRILYNVADIRNTFTTDTMPRGIYIVVIANRRSTTAHKVVL